MFKAAIVIDDWKLSFFETILKREGFTYLMVNGPGERLITLSVQTETVEKLKPFVFEANNSAARNHNRGLH